MIADELRAGVLHLFFERGRLLVLTHDHHLSPSFFLLFLGALEG
jgi:hypothetical protein